MTAAHLSRTPGYKGHFSKLDRRESVQRKMSMAEKATPLTDLRSFLSLSLNTLTAPGP
jgi:hypothetical protein